MTGDVVVCPCCELSVDVDNVVALWDGKSYCRRCVENASPRLVEYAASHTQLEETAQYDRRAILRRFAIMYFAVGLLFGVLFGAYGIQEHGLPGIAYGFVGPLLAGIAAIIQIPGFLWMIKRGMPTVVLTCGTVKVFRGAKKRLVREAPIDACRCRLGKAKRDSGLRGMPIPDKVMLLELPTGPVPGFRRYECVACGWSEEMREVWEAFLRLAGIATPIDRS